MPRGNLRESEVIQGGQSAQLIVFIFFCRSVSYREDLRIQILLRSLVSMLHSSAGQSVGSTEYKSFNFFFG